MVMVETSVRSGFMEPNPFPRTRAEARTARRSHGWRPEPTRTGEYRQRSEANDRIPGLTPIRSTLTAQKKLPEDEPEGSSYPKKIPKTCRIVLDGHRSPERVMAAKHQVDG